MKITVNLDTQTLRFLRAYARKRSLSLGAAATELVKTGLKPAIRTKIVNGWPVFDLPPGSKKVTTEDVRRLLDEFW